MAKLTLEQFKKWSSQLPEGWKFDAQYFVLWGEKRIYTDSTPNAKGVFYRLELEYKETYTRRMDQALNKEPHFSVDRYTPTGENNSFCSVVRIISGNAGEPENKKNYNKLVKIAASLDPETYFKKAAEADTGKQSVSLLDLITAEQEATAEAQEEPTPEEAPEELTEKPEELTDPEPEEPTPAELTAAEEETAEEPKPAELTEEEPTPAEVAETDPAPVEEEPEEAPKNPAPLPNYAELVKAYFTGAKPKKAEPEPKAEPKEEPKPAEPEPEPGPYLYGYAETDNETEPLTAEDRKTLSEGRQVAKSEKHYPSVLFTSRYSDRVLFVYQNRAREVNGAILPTGGDASNIGFLLDGNFYSNYKGISAKLHADIAEKLKELVPDEHSAALTASQAEGWERDKIETAKQSTYDEARARELFFRGQKPELYLYEGSPRYSLDVMIEYLEDPSAVVEREAIRFMCDNAAHIYACWITFNKTMKAYKAITEDPTREEHTMLKISQCVKDEKTVRITLANGHEVKAEASSVKWFASCGWISPWNVAASDRKLLDRNEYGREKDIKLSDIKMITHGGRVLYSA